MNTLTKAIPLSKFHDFKTEIIDFDINIKKNGKLFKNNMSNRQSYKKLIYDNKIYNFSGWDLYKSKIDLFIKTMCNRNILFSFFIKSFFYITFFFTKRSKEKYRTYLDTQNFFSGEFDKKNFRYLESLGINLKPTKFQEIYINRKSFEILNEDQEVEFHNKLNYPKIEKKIVCFHLREQLFNKKNPHLKKNDNVIFYKKKNFENALKNILNKGYKIFDLCNFSETINLDSKNFIELKNKNFCSEEYKYLISKKCEFFISTGGGISELPRLFKKPILRVDHEYNIFHNFSFSTLKDNIIFCHIYSKEKKRFLSIEEQFKNLKKIFPNVSKSSTNFYFNIDEYLLVKNSEDEITNLVSNYEFDEKKISSHINNQLEIFEIKHDFVKKNLPDYFYLVNEFYPKNPYIHYDFFEKNKHYSDYLENKTKDFNKSFSF